MNSNFTRRSWIGGKGWLALLVATSLLTVFCFDLLPDLAKLPSVERRILLYEAKRIDGGATFYTDQPFMHGLLHRLEE